MNILLTFLKMRSKYEKSKYNNYVKFLSLDTENHYYFLNPYKSKNLIDNEFPALKDIPNVTIIEARDFFEDTSWKRSYEFLDDIIEKYSIDKHLILYLGVSSNYRRDNNSIKKDYENSLEDDSYKTKFVLTFRTLSRVIVAYYLSEVKDIDSVQMITDPQEPNFIKNRWYFYDCPEENLTRVPFVEYGFFYDNDATIPEKTKDFTFGCTILTKDRAYMTPQIIQLESDLKSSGISANIHLKDKKAGIDTLVNVDEYNKAVAESRFTLIAPSYDTNHFSSIRFFEALSTDTIPLIHEGSNLEVGLQHYPSLLKIFRKYVVSIDEIPQKIKSVNYEKSIKEIKNNPDYIKLKTDLDFYKKEIIPFFKYEID